MKKIIIIAVLLITAIVVLVVNFPTEAKKQRATLIEDIKNHMRSQAIQTEVQADRIHSCKIKTQVHGWDGYWHDDCQNLHLPEFPEWLSKKMKDSDLTAKDITGGDIEFVPLFVAERRRHPPQMIFKLFEGVFRCPSNNVFRNRAKPIK